jgi:SAM-dependent methyltransferase
VAAEAPAPEPVRLGATDAHYAARTLELRDGSGRSALRQHNNWVKTTLLSAAAKLARAGGGKLRLLDLCCGRGGDLHKHRHLDLSHLVMVDSCLEAVAEAAGRYSLMPGLSTCGKPDGIGAKFLVYDCFDAAPLLPVLAELELAHGGAFDVVSCQFSMHYAFGQERQVRGFLAIVSRALRSGGVFAATTVDDGELAKWRAAEGDSFGNACFHVAFEAEPAGGAGYGAPYRISLEASVDDAREYVVAWDRLVALAAADYELDLVETHNFAAFAAAHAPPEGAAAKVVPKGAKRGRDADGAARERPSETLTDDERATMALFRSLVFRKR